MSVIFRFNNGFLTKSRHGSLSGSLARYATAACTTFDVSFQVNLLRLNL